MIAVPPPTPLTSLFGVGAKNQKLLEKINLTTCEDLLYYFPNRYEDYSKQVLVKDLKLGETVTLKAKLEEIYSEKSPRKRLTITHANFSDNSGQIEIVWFNQPFLANTFKPGNFYYLSGQAKSAYPGLTFEVKEHEAVGRRQIHTGRLIPVYNLTRGLTNRWLRLWSSECIKTTNKISDFLPAELTTKLDLLGQAEALNQIHFPNSITDLSKAQTRLAFNEMFLSQLHHQQAKKKWRSQTSLSIPFNLELTKKILSTLNFKLTNAQRKASWQIIQDLEKPYPMNRLLEGDVGSGKTLVAILCLAQVAKAGYESALMAPTKLLSRQHYKTVSDILGPLGFKVQLTSNETKAKNTRQKTKNTIYIGTHSLIQDRFKFKNLALAIIDEQHRFGVKQRAKLIAKSGDTKTAPHLLSMTATPIPRTLSLTAYGDLDLSVIDEMPKGKKVVSTKIVPPKERSQTYTFVKQRLRQKEQAFIVYPLVEDSDKMNVKSATQEYEKLSKKVFPRFKVALVHGRVKQEERDDIIKKFRDEKIDVLVATSVIEVGIDIPGATMMIIENAERFGLAQLHQFRGRIGRNTKQAFCFLLTSSKAEPTAQRLQALTTCSDGFELAKKDLQIRGPGQVFGSTQSGWPEFKMAGLFNYQLTKLAQESAVEYLPKLNKLPLLKNKLAEFEEEVHFE